MRFGKEETSTEDKKPCLQGFVPSWSFLTRLRRPYLFPCAGKDMEEKVAWGYGVHSASEFRRVPIFQASFHTIVTLRVSDYAPPDTREPGLRAVAFEYLQSIEGAGRIFWSAPFCGEVIITRCRGGALLRPRVLILSEARAEQSPAPTECIQKASPMMRINSRNRKKDDKRRKKRDSKV